LLILRRAPRLANPELDAGTQAQDAGVADRSCRARAAVLAGRASPRRAGSLSVRRACPFRVGSASATRMVAARLWCPGARLAIHAGHACGMWSAGSVGVRRPCGRLAVGIRLAGRTGSTGRFGIHGSCAAGMVVARVGGAGGWLTIHAGHTSGMWSARHFSVWRPGGRLAVGIRRTGRVRRAGGFGIDGPGAWVTIHAGRAWCPRMLRVHLRCVSGPSRRRSSSPGDEQPRYDKHDKQEPGGERYAEPGSARTCYICHTLCLLRCLQLVITVPIRACISIYSASTKTLEPIWTILPLISCPQWCCKVGMYGHASSPPSVILSAAKNLAPRIPGLSNVHQAR
jgi:hypothetical protein